MHRSSLTPRYGESEMADPVSNVIQHDFGLPRIVREEDAEREALYAMLVSLGAKDDGRTADAGFLAARHGVPGDHRLRQRRRGRCQGRDRAARRL
jgi:hypothetical protein